MALNYGDHYVHTVHKGEQDYLIRDSIAEAAINTIQGTGEGSIVKAKSDVIGATGDSGAANTVYGAKAYADSLAGNYDVSGAAAAAQNAVIGSTGDNSSANTVYGAKAYADSVASGAATGVKSEIIGTAGDTGAVDTIKGAKAYADSLAVNYDASGAASTAKSEVIGSTGDSSTANTVYGAKAYADSVASGAATGVKSEVIGSTGDSDTANTVYGAKAYADSKIGNIGDTDVKSYVDDAIDRLAGEDWSQNAKTVKAIIDELSETGNADFGTVVDKVRGDFTYGATGNETTDIKHYIDGKVADSVTGGTKISGGVLTLG